MAKLFKFLPPFILGLPWLILAEDSLSTAVEFPEKTVKSQSQSPERNIENAIVINKDSWEGSGKSLADVIQEYSGIRTRKYGGEGSFQTVSIRGVPGSKILVYLDDLPLNSSSGDAVDLGKINPASVEKIIIYKGFTPGRFGGNSLGGLIHLVTSGQIENNFFGEVSLGSFETQKAGLAINQQLPGPYSYTGRIGHRQAKNDFEYLDRNNTPYNEQDDKWVRQKNSQFSQLEGQHSLKYNSKNLQSNLSFYHSYPKGGIPGREGNETSSSGFTNPSYNWAHSSRLGYFSHQNIRLKIASGYRQELSRFFWSEEDGLTWSGSGKAGDVGSLNRQYSGTAEFHWNPISSTSLEILAGGCYQTLSPKSFSTNIALNSWDNNRTNHFTAAEINYQFLKQVNFNLVSRLERMENNSEGGIEINGTQYTNQQKINFLGSVKAGINLAFHKNLKLFTNIGNYYKIPSMFELYGGKWGILPNPDLKPEKGLNTEIGAQFNYSSHSHRSFLEIILFQTQNRNSVYYVRSANLIKPLNLNSTKSQGLEISSSIQPFLGLILKNHLTFQNPKNTSELVYKGNFIPNEPAAAITSSIEYKLHPLAAYLQFTHDYSSTLYRDQANFSEIPPMHLWHLKISQKFYSKVNLIGEIRNITDVYYENAYSAFPYPGRQFSLTLQIN